MQPGPEPKQPSAAPLRLQDTPPQPEAMQRMLEAAQNFFDCRDRARILSTWTETRSPQSLGEAIERDFAGFDLERAEADFRAALAALSNGPQAR